jgi:hemerythrin
MEALLKKFDEFEKNITQNIIQPLAKRVEELSKQNCELEAMVFIDQLSGLYNRRHALSVMESMFLSYKKENKGFAVIIFDLDHFKKINDNYGHDIGDKVIMSVGKMVSRLTRGSDIGARYGGEEFIIILPETSEGSRIVAEKIMSNFSAVEIEIGDSKKITVTASFGCAYTKPGHSALHELIKEADEKLYKAKETRNTSVC